jgi:hypothetical protein
VRTSSDLYGIHCYPINCIFRKTRCKAEKILKERYPELFDRISLEFSQLQEIREFRNLIAHSVFRFDTTLNDPPDFFVSEIVKPDDKIQYYRDVKYNITHVTETVEKIRSINRKLLEVNIVIEDSFKLRFPGFLG